MKRTCFGCRALGYTGDSKRCELGYKQGWKYRRNHYYSDPIPTEQCPKPTTYERFFELLEEAQNEKA